MQSSHSTLRDIAIGLPGATRILKKFGLDYCCGGTHPLAAACEKASLAPAVVLDALEQAQATPNAQPDWRTQPVRALIQQLLDTHQMFTRDLCLKGMLLIVALIGSPMTCFQYYKTEGK